jgi:hypothetical protein
MLQEDTREQLLDDVLRLAVDPHHPPWNDPPPTEPAVTPTRPTTSSAPRRTQQQQPAGRRSAHCGAQEGGGVADMLVELPNGFRLARGIVDATTCAL